jgi:hypothetical protein
MQMALKDDPHLIVIGPIATKLNIDCYYASVNFCQDARGLQPMARTIQFDEFDGPDAHAGMPIYECGKNWHHFRKDFYPYCKDEDIVCFEVTELRFGVNDYLWSTVLKALQKATCTSITK